MISKSGLKVGHLGSKSMSPDQIKGKPCLHSSGYTFEGILMNFAQNHDVSQIPNWVTQGQK